jgi:predicted nucleic-acid-binding protein
MGRQALRITADTNVLVRSITGDDPHQAVAAMALLRGAEIVVITLPALCELVWVLRQGYRSRPDEIAAVIRDLVRSATVQTDLRAVEAGLAMLDAGGDFADGVIAFAGRQLGGPVFASFDRKAVELVLAAGGETHLLGT